MAADEPRPHLLEAGSLVKVSLFVTCLVDQFFPQVGLSTVKILERFGVEVDFDFSQTCCSQPAFNAGYREEARQVARHFLKTYRSASYVVVPSGSCAAMIKLHLPDLFEPSSPQRRLSEEIAGRVWELSDFLCNVLQIESTGARFKETVTYHDSCHLLRELGVIDPPRKLLGSVVGLDLRELPQSDRCCGFGGLFSIKLPELSVSMGADKIAAIEATGSRYVVANDAGCLMHLRGLLDRRKARIGTLHLAELLARFD